MNRYFSSYVPYNANVIKVKTVTFWLQPMLCHHVYLQSSFQRIVFASHCLCSLQMVEWAGRWFLYSKPWDYPWNFDESLGQNKGYTLI